MPAPDFDHAIYPGNLIEQARALSQHETYHIASTKLYE